MVSKQLTHPAAFFAALFNDRKAPSTFLNHAEIKKNETNVKQKGKKKRCPKVRIELGTFSLQIARASTRPLGILRAPRVQRPMVRASLSFSLVYLLSL